MKKAIPAAIGLILICAFAVTLALAQSSPNWTTGKVPTAAEWNAAWASKQNTLGYTALRKNGDVMLGLLRFSMSAPTPTSCGTNPTITGSNQAGTVTMGTGSPTGCTITFNTDNPWSATPSCVVTWQANLASMQYVVTQTTITLTQTGTSSNKVSWFCAGLQ